MRSLPAILALCAALLPAAAPAQQPQARPQLLGEHTDWTAATHMEGGQKVCYAFTRPTRSEGAGERQGVMLSVTHRPGQRDAVILSAGYAYPRGAEVTVTVGGTELDFYTAGSSAAARDADAAIRAFRAGREAVARGPGPGGRGTVRDSFSLLGFTAAYEAISRECPPRR
jgi:invasion protein IalB